MPDVVHFEPVGCRFIYRTLTVSTAACLCRNAKPRNGMQGLVAVTQPAGTLRRGTNRFAVE